MKRSPKQEAVLRYGQNIRWIKGACANLRRVSRSLGGLKKNTIALLELDLLAANKSDYESK